MNSLWENDTEKKEFPCLTGDRKTDTVVIGGGMAGILTAYYLKQEGVPVMVLEADRVGNGQTGRTTAKITSQHNLIYDKLLRVFGKEMTMHYARANEKAIDAYEQLIKLENIDCDFERCSSVLFSRKAEEALKAEIKAAKQLGLPVRYKNRTELPFSVEGALEFQNQARFQPLHFLYHLAEQLPVYEKTRVLRVEGNIVETDQGMVEAKNIVFATHYPFVNVPGYFFATEKDNRICNEGIGSPQPRDDSWDGKTADSCSKKKGQ
ncbi:MAG: FAD-binding oxidoreductase [Lachnospiraceae bacterium]|nr:FAD-binding oxidoreductase [Lachnospiraceae bacterium]